MFKKLFNFFIISSLLLSSAPATFAQGQTFRYKISVFNKSPNKTLVAIRVAGESIAVNLAPGKSKELIVRLAATKEDLKNIQLVFEGQEPLDKPTDIDENKKSFLLNSKAKIEHKVNMDEDGDLFFGESSGGVISSLTPDKGETPDPKVISLSSGANGAGSSVIAQKLSELPHLLLISASANGELHTPRGFFFGYSKTSIDPVPLSVVSEYYEDLGLYGLEDAADLSSLESEVLKSALGNSELYFALSLNPKNGGFEIFAIGGDEPKKLAEVDGSFYIGYLQHRNENGDDSTKIVISGKNPAPYLKTLNKDNKNLSSGTAHRLFSFGKNLKIQEIKGGLGFGLLKIAMAQTLGGYEQQEVVEEIVEVSEDSLVCPDIPALTAPAVELPADVTGATGEASPKTGASTPTGSKPAGAPKDTGGILDFFEQALGEGGIIFGGQVKFGGSKGAETTIGLLGGGGAIGVDPNNIDFSKGFDLEKGTIFGGLPFVGGIPGTEGKGNDFADPFGNCGKSSMQEAVDEYIRKEYEKKNPPVEERTIPTGAGRTTETGGLRRFTEDESKLPGIIPTPQLPQLQPSIIPSLKSSIQTPSGGLQLIR